MDWIGFSGQTGGVEAHVESRLATADPPIGVAGTQRPLRQRHAAAAAEAAAAAAAAESAAAESAAAESAAKSAAQRQSDASPPEIGHEPRPRTSVRGAETRPGAAAGLILSSSRIDR